MQTKRLPTHNRLLEKPIRPIPMQTRQTPNRPAETLENYLDQISTQSPIYEFTGTRTQKFQQALAILSPPWRSNMEAKLKAQLLALWLNYVAGWTEGYKYKGMTAWEIIQGSENALLNHQTTNTNTGKTCATDSTT
jgi:hypothetical protein